jgi:hypothetical protein
VTWIGCYSTALRLSSMPMIDRWLCRCGFGAHALQLWLVVVQKKSKGGVQ